MSTVINTPGDFSKLPYGVLLPTEKFLFFCNLGGDQASSVKNLANAAAPLTVVGSPVYGTKDVSLVSGVRYYNTGLAEMTTGTLISVHKQPSPAATELRHLVSARSGSSGSGMILESASPNRYGYNIQMSGGAAPRLIATAPAADTYILSMLEKDGVNATFTDVTRSLSVTRTLDEQERVVSTNNYRIGSEWQAAAGSAEIRMAFAAIANGLLTSDEKTETIAVIRSLMSAKAITV